MTEKLFTDPCSMVLAADGLITTLANFLSPDMPRSDR